MDCSIGDIDLNRAHTDTLSDDETPREDHGSVGGLGVPQDGDGPGVVGTIEDSNIMPAMIEANEVLRTSDQEEPEEGEISDDNAGQETSNLDDGDKETSAEGAGLPAFEPSTAASKAATSSYGSRWANRSNGDNRHGAWNLRSEASAYPAQPDKFFQFAWAKGVQESPSDSLGESLPDETAMKTRKTGDSGRPLTRTSSADRKSEWIRGDRGIYVNYMRNEDGYLKYMRNEDGYFFLQGGGDRSDQRRGEGWRERGDRGSAERGGKSSSDKSNRDYRHQSEERNSSHDRERRRPESRRLSREIRKRDGRGEGDLEEGEIELKQAIMVDKAAMERHMKGREKDVGRQGDKLYVKETGLGASFLSESQREKLFADVANNVRNVSVKDAQKSFMCVCRQLRRALRTLRDLNKDLSKVQGKHLENQQRRVVPLTRDIFSGIRATYAVRNTAVGKEQEQEQDPNAFSRLLELARKRCESLFTSKQLQELDSMMQAIGYRSKLDEPQKVLRKALSASHQTGGGEEVDLKVGESSGNTSATTQLESESTTVNSANVRTLELGDEAEQPLNLTVDLNICEPYSEEQSTSALDGSTVGSTSFNVWLPYGREPGRIQKHDDSKVVEFFHTPKPSSVVDLNEGHVFVEGSLEDKDEFSGSSKTVSAGDQVGGISGSHFDHIRALSYYHEKFAGKSQATRTTRLPSPTPSDEGEGIENSIVDASVTESYSGCNDEDMQAGKDGHSEELVQVSSVATQQEPSFLPKDSPTRTAPPELTLFPGSEMPSAEDGSFELFQAKMLPSRGTKRSRDPRRRFDCQNIDLELPQPENMGAECIAWPQESSMVPSTDASAPNQQVLKANQEVVPVKGELLSLLTLATGAWSSEQTPAAPIIPDAGLQTTTVSSSAVEESSQKKRQIDHLSEDTSGNKRPRTALILKDGDVGRPKGLGPASVDVADNSKQELSSEMLLIQPGPLLKQSVSGIDSGVSDSLKQRMKPRDPRRALLGASIQDKSKIMAVVREISSLAASGPEATTQSFRETVISNSDSSFTRNAAESPFQTNSNSTNEASPAEKSVSSANMPTVVRANSITKNETLPVVGSVALQSAGSMGLFCESDLSGNNGRSDDLTKTNRLPTGETKVTVAKLQGRFDLNVSAGKQRENINHWDHLEPLLEGLDEKQKQAVRQERARRIEEQSRMFVAKKLCLVLDLDHTLLNSAKFTEIEEEWEVKLQANELTERSKFGKEASTRRELYRFQHMGMWTKLRPGIWNFLARASHLYELHVYTMGNKAYATEMAKLLDPTGALFAGRVISKGDDGDVVDGDERPPKSKDLDGVLGMESAVVIIDDSARVWPHHRHNLIVVERYMYFPSSRKQFGLPGPSLLEVGHDEREQDGMLASALKVIEKIHYNFFSNPRLHEVDVRDILAKEQHKVLGGCKLVFSRVFPQGEIQPHLHPLWQLAEQFGAVCSMGLDDGVTHVVAISLGTEKVNWALSTGRFVVRPSWLEASTILYRRANERDFSVTA